METLFVDKEVVTSLKRTQELIEELLETIDILSDEEAMQAIAESKREFAEGSTKPFSHVLKNLGIKASG